MGLMHRHITHNRCHASFKQFSEAVLTFLREEVPRKWQTYCDEVTDNFRIISPQTDGRDCRSIPYECAVFRGLGLYCRPRRPRIFAPETIAKLAS